MSRRLALLIANSLNQPGNYRLLKAPEADVKALSSLLKRADIGFFDEVEVSINETIDLLRKKVDVFFRGKKPDDQLLLYFSGHGDRDSAGRLCLVGRNTEKGFLASTSITSSFIKEVMDDCKSRQQILVLDCCYADAFFQAKGEVQIGEHMPVPFSGRGRIVLTAASITQEAYEGEQEQDEDGLSIFTHYLVEGLESGKADRDNDGWISVDEWYQYAYERVTEIRADQTPGRWVEKQQGSIVIAKNPLLSGLSESSRSFVAAPDIALGLEYKSSVVLISSVDQDNRNFGTGFVIGQEEGHTYILTCAHVIRNAKDEEGKVKVNNVIAEEVDTGTPNEADDLGILRVEGLLGAPLIRRNIGNEGMSFTSFGYQNASTTATVRSKESVLPKPLQGELGELNLQRIRGQGFRIKFWTLKNKDVWQLDPAYSGAPIVVKTEAGEDVVIGVLSTQQRERILAISIEELDRVWSGPTYIPFTNREDELKIILSARAPAYYLIDAPSGYGKTTLLRELRKQFSERKWICAYLALDSSLQMDELAEAVAENLSIFHLLPSSMSNQGAGFRLGSALKRYWSNSQEGLVLLFDLDPGPGNSELLERLLKEFIPDLAESLETFSPFSSGDNRFRVVIAGRYLNSHYNRLSIQNLPIRPSRLYLSPFKYDVIHNTTVDYLKPYRHNQVRQLADHILYLTGGHPGCMAKVLKLFEERGMPTQKFVDLFSDRIWTDIVEPVVSTIATKVPSSLGVQQLMSHNVLRYMDYAVLRKLIDLLEIPEVRDEFDLSDQLTYSTSLYWNNHLLRDDITRRLISISLRNSKSDEFIQSCQIAQTICKDLLNDSSTFYSDVWAIEYLFQFLQGNALLINNSEQREELRRNFMSQELPKVLDWLVTGRKAQEQKMHLLRSIEEDWEFMFTVNYYLRKTEYNDDAVEELKSHVNHLL